MDRFSNLSRSKLMSEIACRGIFDAKRPMRLRTDDELRALLVEWEESVARMNRAVAATVKKALG